MRPISRILLSCGGFAAFLAPMLQAQAPSLSVKTHALAAGTVHSISPNRPPLQPTFLGDSGFGAGSWIPASLRTLGFASAQLFDEAGRERYTMRASLLPAQSGLPGMDQQGGFLGQLFSVDGAGRKTAFAEVSGKWIRHPNGIGEFDVEVIGWSGDRNQPYVSLGSIQGSLLPPGIMPGPDMEPVDEDGTIPALPGELVLVWNIPQP